MSKKNPGHYIKQWRFDAGMTQADLGKAAGMSASSVNQIEGGHTGYTQVTLQKLAAALDVSPAVLLSVNPQASHPDAEVFGFSEEVIGILKSMSLQTRALAHQLLLACLKHDEAAKRIAETQFAKLNAHKYYHM